MDWVLGITWLIFIILCWIFWPRKFSSDKDELDELIALEDELRRVQALIAADPRNVLRRKRPEIYLKMKLQKKRDRLMFYYKLESDHELAAMLKERREEHDKKS